MRTFPILLLFVTGAAAACQLDLQNPRPIVLKTFGSKTAILKKDLTSIQLSVNETVTFHCPTGISINRGSYNSQNTKINAATAELMCGEDGIYLDKRQIIEERSNAQISCTAGFKKALYESNISLPGCDGDSMTLLIGYRLKGFLDVKLLGMCYDLSASHLRFVSFLAYAPRNLLLEARTEHELDALQLDSYIGSLTNYFRYPNEAEFNQMIERQKLQNELFVPQLFEYASLLQDEQQIKELSDYEDMLNIVWLRALRLGNWKHWLKALRAASDGNDAVKFDVRVGVSGMAALPLTQSCNTSRIIQLQSSNGDISLPVPAYIWAHVQSLSTEGNETDEFVIVAHNSPYVNVLELSSFCVDMCADIPWLSNSLFGQLHLVPNYGVIHCCHVDQLSKLTDFPLAKHSAPPITTPTPTSTSSLLPPLISFESGAPKDF